MKWLTLRFVVTVTALSMALYSCGYYSGDHYPDAVYVFSTSGQYTGLLGGRSGLDALCITEYGKRYSDLERDNVRALVNVSAGDEIRDMPSNYGVPTDLPVQGADGPIIGGSWGDILDGSLMHSLYDSAILPDSATWWSGEGGSGDGSIGADHCSNWTSDSGPNGSFGGANSTALAWISGGTAGCGSSRYVLCIAW